MSCASPKTRRRTLTGLLSRLDRQIVRDVFFFASATYTRTLLRRATRDLQPYPRNTIWDQDASDHEGSDDWVPLSGQPNKYAKRVRSFVPQNAERFDALLATVGMASLRGVSKVFRDIIDEMAAREHLAEFGVWHVETAIPANAVEDYIQLKDDPQARNAILLRRGAPWAALADRVRAVVALMTAMLAHDPPWGPGQRDLSKSLHGKYIRWEHQQKNALSRAFVKTGWTTPWVMDAHDIYIDRGTIIEWRRMRARESTYEFDTNDPRCVALRAFAVSLAPPSSAGEIGDLPPGRTEEAVLFRGFSGCPSSFEPPVAPHFLTSFCAFSFRPNDDDFTTRVDDEDCCSLGYHSRRGGYAVRVADLREPESGSVESVRRWDQFWAEEEDSDRDYDDDFDSVSSHVDYASFENPFADRLPPIVLDTVHFEMNGASAEVRLEFRFADCSACGMHLYSLCLHACGQIRLQTGGLCFSRPDLDDA